MLKQDRTEGVVTIAARGAPKHGVAGDIPAGKVFCRSISFPPRPTRCTARAARSCSATAFSTWFHIGHLRHLKSAREFGDLLVVSLTGDKFVNKGPDRPAFPSELRAELMAALDLVDFVTVVEEPSALHRSRRLGRIFLSKAANMSTRHKTSPERSSTRRSWSKALAANWCLPRTSRSVRPTCSITTSPSMTKPREIIWRGCAGRGWSD
jgi:cytidyltransferase-like protein